MRRFTRLTNAFSKSLRNLKDALALHFAHYNFVRIHGSLRVTPAMAAGVQTMHGAFTGSSTKIFVASKRVDVVKVVSSMVL